jgi:hypothetical protein
MLHGLSCYHGDGHLPDQSLLLQFPAARTDLESVDGQYSSRNFTMRATLFEYGIYQTPEDSCP